jgi:hypothetical protein
MQKGLRFCYVDMTAEGECVSGEEESDNERYTDITENSVLTR